MISMNVFRWQLIHGACLRSTPKVIVQSLSTRAPDTSKATNRRRNREDIKTKTSFHSTFSKWKILSGPYDWENYLMGKEGAEKYRTQNLPTTCSPGLYELGILLPTPEAERKPRNISSRSVIIVYVGQSENVRARTQQYGRNGAHLENTANLDSPTTTLPGLFSHIFSKGFAIVCRWAPTRSKRDAEVLEDELLRKYDYAWNKRSNGDRRINDIHEKLESRARVPQVSLLNMIPQYYIKTCCPFISWNQNSSATHHFNNEHKARIRAVEGRNRRVGHKEEKVSNLRIEEKARDEHPINEKFKLWSYIGKWFSR